MINYLKLHLNLNHDHSFHFKETKMKKVLGICLVAILGPGKLDFSD